MNEGFIILRMRTGMFWGPNGWTALGSDACIYYDKRDAEHQAMKEGMEGSRIVSCKVTNSYSEEELVASEEFHRCLHREEIGR
jgi:hypothetical protein